MGVCRRQGSAEGQRKSGGRIVFLMEKPLFTTARNTPGGQRVVSLRPDSTLCRIFKGHLPEIPGETRFGASKWPSGASGGLRKSPGSLQGAPGAPGRAQKGPRTTREGVSKNGCSGSMSRIGGISWGSPIGVQKPHEKLCSRAPPGPSCYKFTSIPVAPPGAPPHARGRRPSLSEARVIPPVPPSPSLTP